MRPEICACLLIQGTFDPSIVTDSLGVAPRRVFRAGQSRGWPNSEARYRCDGWVSHPSSGEPLDAETYVKNLVNDFWPKREILKALAADKGCDVSVAVAVRLIDQDGIVETPSLCLNRETMSRLVELGADVDFDLYVLDAPSDS